MWGEIAEYKWTSRLWKLSAASLFTKLHSSKRKELKDRESFKSLHCNSLTFYQTSQLLCIVIFSPLPVFSHCFFFFCFNKRMHGDKWASWSGALHEARCTHPRSGSTAIPLGFCRSNCTMVTHVSPRWSHANILSAARSTKYMLPVSQSMAMFSTSAEAKKGG